VRIYSRGIRRVKSRRGKNHEKNKIVTEKREPKEIYSKYIITVKCEWKREKLVTRDMGQRKTE